MPSLLPPIDAPARNSNPPVPFWIVDDEDHYRNTMELGIQLEGGVKCTGSFPDAESALEHGSRIGRMPTVILLDIGLPGISGTAAISKFLAIDAVTRVVILSVRTQGLFRALYEGAVGYLYKPTSRVKDVAEAISDAARGGFPIDPYLMGELVMLARQSLRSLVGFKLSPAESRVAELLWSGLRVKEVAENLNLSVNTVSTHVKSILRKCGVHSIRELIVRFNRSFTGAQLLQNDS